jgi:hypothetical protein
MVISGNGETVMKRSLLKLVLSVLVISTTILACNSLTIPLSAFTSSPTPPVLKVTTLVSAAQGANIMLPDGATVRIPPGSLKTDTEVTIQAIQGNGPTPTAEDVTITAGKIYDINLGAEPLEAPVTLEIPFDPSLLPGDVEPGQAFLSTFDEETGTWVYAGGAVDLTRNVITLPVSHASLWKPSSWNWSAWLVLLNNTLKLNLTGMYESAKLMVDGCEQVGEHVRVEIRENQTLLQGCIDKDDPHQPSLRLVNPRLIFYEVSSISGGGNYPPKKILAPGGSLPFVADTQDRSPLIVTATLTQESTLYLGVNMILAILPGLNQLQALNDVTVRGQQIACLANNLPYQVDIINMGKAIVENKQTAAVQAFGKFLMDESKMLALIKAGRECKIGPASTWSLAGLNKIGSASSLLMTEVDYLATYLSGNIYGEVAFYWTAPSTPTPAFTPTPAPTATPLPTSTPQPVSSLRGTVQQLSNCRYGPDWPYLYKYGVGVGTRMEVIGRDMDGDWLYVQGIGGNNACWIKAVQIQVDGDVMSLSDAYPLTKNLPISPFFPQITITSVSNSGGTVNVNWMEHIVREDLNTEQGIEYIVEIWTCVGGKPTFYALGTNDTSASFEIDNSCGITSHADVIGEDKEGFSPPAIIALP